MSNTQLEELLADEPEEIQDEIRRINTDARPIALQVALGIPLLAALLGFLNALRMVRVPDPTPSSSAEGMAFGEREERATVSEDLYATLGLKSRTGGTLDPRPLSPGCIPKQLNLSRPRPASTTTRGRAVTKSGRRREVL